MSKYLDIYERFRALIANGDFRPGDRLPSMRRIATEGGHGINTVRSAYSLLERDGMVRIVERGRVVVTAGTRFPEPRVSETEQLSWNQNEIERLDLVLEKLVRSDPGFAVAAPGTDLLPNRQIGRLFGSLGGNWLGYSDPSGEAELRRRIALHYEPVNGRTSPDRILITNGATEAIFLLIHTFVRPGDTVVLESPTYFDYFRQLSAAGARVVEVRVDPGAGLAVSALERLLRRRRVRMVIVQPNVHNPTGGTMPDEDKEKLVALCASHETVLVQDDVYGDLAYGPRRSVNLPLFQDLPNLFLVSSLSKSLSPGLRIGWIRAGGQIDRLADAKVRSSLCSARPNQIVAAEYLATTNFPRHLQRIRTALAGRLEEYLQLLEGVLPAGTAVSRPSGGCLLWIAFPAGIDATEVFLHAARQGIVGVPGELFSSSSAFRNYFRINFGRSLIPPRVSDLRRLAEIVRGARN